MPKCDFNKVVLFVIFAEHLFLGKPLEGCFCHWETPTTQNPAESRF